MGVTANSKDPTTDHDQFTRGRQLAPGFDHSRGARGRQFTIEEAPPALSFIYHPSYEWASYYWDYGLAIILTHWGFQDGADLRCNIAGRRIALSGMFWQRFIGFD